MKKGRAMIDLTGLRFGAWSVLECLGPCQNHNIKWLCLCDCGTRKAIEGGSLKRGLTNSCGCQLASRAAAASTKHGHSGGRNKKPSKTYMVWNGMISRCNGHGKRGKLYYKDRGIVVCERWKAFENFLADMGEAPPGLSLDRMDNDGNYEPGNCRWATWNEQARNRRYQNWAGQTVYRGKVITPQQ